MGFDPVSWLMGYYAFHDALAGSTFLRLDCANDPLTAPLDITNLAITPAGSTVSSILNLSGGFTPTGDSAATYGIFLEPQTYGTRVVSMAGLYSKCRVYDTGDYGVYYGIQSDVVNRSDHDIAMITGVYGSALQETNSAGNCLTAVGGYFVTGTQDGTGTIADAYGVYIDAWTDAGDITNLYGLYISDYYAGATGLNYAIYSLSPSPSLFTGVVKAGEPSEDDDLTTKLYVDDLIGGLEVVYALELDEAAPYTYVGEALPGTGTGVAEWRIKRIEDLGGGDIEILWASGDSDFSHKWTEHNTTIIYS